MSLKQQLILLDKEDLEEVIRSVMLEVVSSEILKVKQSEVQTPLLTRNEVAKMLSVSMPTLLKWEKDGSIPKPKRLGNRVYWSRQSLYDFLESS